MYLGSWKIDDYLTFPANAHDPADGAASDADSAPTYRIYEDETGTPIVTGSMAKLDDANTTGFYTERVQLTSGAGFEKGKCYTIYVEATIAGTKATASHTFQVEAEVDANAEAIADAVLDEVLSGHTGAGSLGKAVADIEDDAHLAKAAAVNKTEDNQNTGERKIFDDNETDVLVTLQRQSDQNGTITREVPQ